jgi:hypothetical protein
MRSQSKTNIWLNIKYSIDKIIHIFHIDTVDRDILRNAVYLQSLQFVLWKESLNVMSNNSTNINKMKNHLSRQTIEHK